MGERTRSKGRELKRGEVWWADLGAYRPREQMGRRPVVIWQSDTLTQALQSILVVPLTTNLDRANLAGTALIASSPVGGPPHDSVALAFQQDRSMSHLALRPGRSGSRQTVAGPRDRDALLCRRDPSATNS